MLYTLVAIGAMLVGQASPSQSSPDSGNGPAPSQPLRLAPPPTVISQPPAQPGATAKPRNGMVAPVANGAPVPAPSPLVLAPPVVLDDNSAPVPVKRHFGLVPPLDIDKHIASVNASAPQRSVVQLYPWMRSTGLPDSFNWEDVAGVVQPAVDQADCGSCWCNATCQAYDISYALQGGGLIRVSRQQVLTCNGQNYSCAGGWWPTKIFASGVGPESADPYTANDGRCPAGLPTTYKSSTGFYLGSQSGIVDAPTIQAALLQGPVLTGFNATPAFQNFSGTGIFQNITNGVGGVNHAITIIGYDKNRECPDGTKGAWRILNSWGTSWGDAGKAWVAANTNAIGYACFVMDALVTNPGPIPGPGPAPNPAPSPTPTPVPINPVPVVITPNAPDSVTAFVSAPTSVLIQWRDTNGGGVPYVVYREDWPLFTVSTVTTTANGISAAWDTKAVAGQTYTYVVRAISGTAMSGPSNAVTVRTPAQ